MSIKRKEIDAFINSFDDSFEKFSDILKMHSQSKNDDEFVSLHEDVSLGDEIESLIISLAQLAQKSDIKIYVGRVGD